MGSRDRKSIRRRRSGGDGRRADRKQRRRREEGSMAPRSATAGAEADADGLGVYVDVGNARTDKTVIMGGRRICRIYCAIAF